MGGAMKKAMALLLFLFLSGGCSAFCRNYCKKEAMIPIPVPCPIPPVISRPHLPIADLKGPEAPDVVIRAYVLSVEELMGYSLELEILLNGYRKLGVEE